MRKKSKLLTQTFESYRTLLLIAYLLIVCPVIQAQTSPKAKRLSLKLSNTTIIDALKNVENSSDYVFLFSDAIKSNLRAKVNVNVKNATINELMSDLLNGTQLSYFVNNRQVTISKSHTQQNHKQQPKATLKITGQVLDEKGETMIGVTIQEVGTNNMVATDVNGRFTLYNVASTNSMLKFTYVGYKEKTVKVNNDKNLVVNMQTDTQGLDEVVVVGYSQQKRQSVIGAISTIKPSTLLSDQSRSVSNALAGQIAGVIAVQRSGEPGEDSSDFWIRGVSTFGTNKTPLILVDGVERSLVNISAEEIESFSVLKDATATAVYGVRGANGVILIETKKGKIGKPVITVKADYGITTPTQMPKFVNGAKYMEVMNAANILSGSNPTYSEAAIQKTRNHVDTDLYPDVDWIDLVTTKTAPQMHASLDINGGSERLRYSLIVAFMGEHGMMATDKNVSYDSTDKMYKYNVRSNVDINITPSTIVNVGIGGYITNIGRSATNISTVFSECLDTPPISYPAVYSNGQFPIIESRYNPWAAATQSGYRRIYQNSFESTVSAIQDIGKLWKPLKGLRLKALFSFDAYQFNNAVRSKSPSYYYATGRDINGNLITTQVSEGQEFLSFSQSSAGNRTMYFETRLNYNRTFGKHTVEGLLTSSIRDYYNGNTQDSELALPYRDAGMAGRAAYNYDDRYFAEFNFGYNGSENFKRGYRFGFFPSFAIGWVATNEKFMQPYIKVLSKFKLRGSWGKVGNDNISSSRRFGYLSTIDNVAGSYFGTTGNVYETGYQEGDFGIPNLTWETSTKTDIGLELGFLNWINLQVDYFCETRKDIFMQRKTIPETAGYNVMPYANFGKVKNQGFDCSLEATKRFNKSLTISVRANYTYAKNKVIEYDESPAYKKTTLAQTGKPMYSYLGLIAERLYRNSDFSDPENGTLANGVPPSIYGTVYPGDIKYKDLNKDNKIDSYDRTYIGKPSVPQVIYGFGFNVKYKNVDLGMFFQGADDFSNMLSGSTLIPGTGGGARGNIYNNVDDRWTVENPRSDVFWPRLSNTVSSTNMRYSTWWLRDAAYLRLKNMEVGYTFPKSWQRPLRMRNARVFFRGNNLFTWAKFNMWDPEIGSQNGFSYPLMKVYSIGVEVTF